ncbi:MAG: hypothetical protein HY077_04185 [Elusimicrobia bacterium]|nr:hypothetical protein [Elusimicrobiota bacterium]
MTKRNWTRRAAALLALASLLCPPAFAADAKPQPPVKAEKKAARTPEDANFKILFKMKVEELESAGSFVAQGGTEGDYHLAGEDPVETENPAGKGVEYKKHTTIVSCIPVSNPNNGRVRSECQFELSGALRPVGSLKMRPTVTFQYKGAFEVALGSAIVLVDDPTRRLEVRIEEVKP